MKLWLLLVLRAFGIGTLRLLRGKHEMESLILTTALLASGAYLRLYSPMLPHRLPA